MTSTDERPLEEDECLVPGHWEGDMVSANNSFKVDTLVERTS